MGSHRRAGRRWLAAAALGACTAHAAASEWILVDIGTLGGPGSYGAAVNDAGTVVGCADLPAGGAHPFIYRDGVIRDLEPGAPATASGCALAVNNRDVAAGRSTTGELALWDGAGTTRLGIRGDVGGMNDSGAVVGSYALGAATRAFLYREGRITDLGTLGGDGDNASSAAAAINEQGQVVGASNGRAFLYEAGAMRDLGTLGGGVSSARGINDRSEVVGMATNAHGQPTPFLYDGAMRVLPGPEFSGAIAIDNRRQVVGSGEGTYGYVIDNGAYASLDALPAVRDKRWRHLEPTGINDRGWIVGTASDAQGALRAFLLLPSDKVLRVSR